MRAIVVNEAGGPEVLLHAEHPDPEPGPGQVVVEAAYAAWSARGAQFLTPPKEHPYETRCYIRDPDGYLIEVGQTTDPKGDWMPDGWSPR